MKNSSCHYCTIEKNYVTLRPRKLIYIKKVILCLMILCLYACNYKEEEYKIMYSTLNNNELKNEIVEYDKAIQDSLEDKAGYIIHAFLYNVNDSISRCVLTRDLGTQFWNVTPVHFVCQVDGKEVLFTTLSAVDLYSPAEPMIASNEELRLYIMKHYFPKEYDAYLENPNKLEFSSDHSDNTILTFYKGHIVGKSIGAWTNSTCKYEYKIGDETFRN